MFVCGGVGVKWVDGGNVCVCVCVRGAGVDGGDVCVWGG